MTDPQTHTATSIDVELGPGRRTLRVTLEGDALILAEGFGGGTSPEPFHRPGWSAGPIRLPADALPELREAFEKLEATTEEA